MYTRNKKKAASRAEVKRRKVSLITAKSAKKTNPPLPLIP
jgi:hypothetical protein